MPYDFLADYQNLRRQVGWCMAELARRAAADTMPDRSVAGIKLVADTITDAEVGVLSDASLSGLSTSKLIGSIGAGQIADVWGGSIQGGTIGSGPLAIGAATVVYAMAGTTSSPSAPGSMATMPEMAVSGDFGGNTLIIGFSGTFTGTSGGQSDIVINDGTVDVGHSYRRISLAGGWTETSTFAVVSPAAGGRTVSVRWTSVAGSSVVANAVQRVMWILERRR